MNKSPPHLLRLVPRLKRIKGEVMIINNEVHIKSVIIYVFTLHHKTEELIKRRNSNTLTIQIEIIISNKISLKIIKNDVRKVEKIRVTEIPNIKK